MVSIEDLKSKKEAILLEEDNFLKYPYFNGSEAVVTFSSSGTGCSFRKKATMLTICSLLRLVPVKITIECLYSAHNGCNNKVIKKKFMAL